MTTVNATTDAKLSDMLGDVTNVIYNPTSIQRTILSYLENVTSGTVDVVDPTSPFVFVLEASAVNTAAAVQENMTLLRRQYASLAQNEEELHLHMSDKDFIDLFATPADTKFKITIQYTDMLVKMVDYPAEQCKKLTIPRNTEFSVNGYVFSIQYPIDIRLFYNDVLQVSYDASYVSPLQTLSTNVIDYTLAMDASGVRWLTFTVDVSQFSINSTFPTLQNSKTFSQDIAFTDKYYYCRVFYKSNTSGGLWTEMKTTYTDQVYDPMTPTAVLKVGDGVMNVYIPQVYLNTGLLAGNVRIDVYTTKGAVYLNMSNYLVNAFTMSLKGIDTERDASVFTAAMANVNMMTYSAEIVSGGNDSVSFEDQRSMVIDNSVGNRLLPITNVQLEDEEIINGFAIVKNTDLVTNRILLATRSLPAPSNTELVTPANMTIATLTTTLEALSAMKNVKDNGARMTLLSNSLYLSMNGQLAVYPFAKAESLKHQTPSVIAATINAGNFLYSPFYYVLDNSLDEFEARAYHLDQPTSGDLAFISQNVTAELQVNTSSYLITKTDTGYKLQVLTKSDALYQKLGDQYLNAQLAYYPVGENALAYVNGTQLLVTSEGERVFEFLLDSTFDIDNNNYLSMTGFKMFTNEHITTKSNLVEKFHIFYTTSSVPQTFVADAANNLIGSYFLPSGSICITHETLSLTFGYALGNLWTQCRSVASGLDYKVYMDDIPLTYSETVYKTDPATGTIFSIGPTGDLVYTVEHQAGDVVTDSAGATVYQHRKGDIMMDGEGKPLINSYQNTTRYIDLLLIDGSYYFATDSVYTAYQNEVAATVTTWVTEQIDAIEEKALDKTSVYFRPKKASGLVSVRLDSDTTASIEASQSFAVSLYVKDTIYKDETARKKLERQTVTTLDDQTKSSTVSISDMIQALKNVYGSSVVSVSLSGLGGSANYETVTLLSSGERLGLKKKLVVQDDGSIYVAEDVTVSFVNYLS